MLLNVQKITFTYTPLSSGKYTGLPPSFTLNNISFSVQKKEKIALVGSNGSGKTTLLLHIAGCLTPQNGSIYILNELITGKPKKAGKHTALLFQNPDVQLLLPSFREEILFVLKMLKTPKERYPEQIHAIASMFDCTHLIDKAPQRLSIGEKQRIALSLLLALQPKILLLDEPTASLDPKTRTQLIKLLQKLEIPMLIATHDLDMALAVTDRTLILHNGNLTTDDLTKHVLTNKNILTQNNLELPLTLQGLQAPTLCFSL